MTCLVRSVPDLQGFTRFEAEVSLELGESLQILPQASWNLVLKRHCTQRHTNTVKLQARNPSIFVFNRHSTN